jgi:25S rRNA (cytosine2278-C5)-methyltransferase
LHRNPLEGVANRGLLFVLLYELLEGPNRAIKGGGSVKRMLLNIEPELRRDWDALTKERRGNVAKDGESGGESGTANVAAHPRYVRVNTLVATKASIVEALAELHVPFKDDRHVPDLLVVPAKDADTTRMLVELAPRVVLQDKSSCLPALCLVHGYGTPLVEGDCLDACAAPGNKTLHLAALLASVARDASTCNDNIDSKVTTFATVHAFDKDPRRCRDLKRRVDQHTTGSSSPLRVRIKVQCDDFLSLQPDDFPNVRAILLDPTCSGSGTVAGSTERRRCESHVDDDGDNGIGHRLQSLSRFQCAALRHAMSFPSCQRIVYSTCSVHDVENEQVVVDALRHHETEDQGHQPQAWTIVPPRCLSKWARRGRLVAGLTQEQASALVRVDPNEDETGGFFVACFERLLGPAATSAAASSSSSKSKKKRASNSTDTSLLGASATKRPKGPPRASSDVDAEDTVDGAATVEEPGKSTRSSGHSSSSSADLSSSAVDAKAGEGTSKKRLKKLQWKQKQREEKQRRLQEPKAT